MNIALCLVVFVAHFPILLQAQSNSVSTLRFYAAQPEGQFITFDPPAALDWEALLPDSIRYLVKNTDQEEVLQRIVDRRGMFGSMFEYTLDIHAEIPNRWYYLLSPEGFSPVSLKSIRGYVRFIFRSNREEDRRILRVQYGGKLVGTLEAGASISNYGFVVWTKSALKANIVPSSRSADDLHGNSSYYKHGTEFWNIVNQYELTFSGMDIRYVFVQWVPDAECVEGCCAIRLSLYQIGDSNLLIKSNNFRCDI